MGILSEYEREYERIQATAAKIDASANGWPEPIDLLALFATDPQPPRMIIPDWLPCGYATLLAGHGGAGKSYIALYLAACIAAGRDFFGLEVSQRRVLYLSCEDRTDALHWRLERIRRHIGAQDTDLAGQLSVIDLVGHPAVLVDQVPGSGVGTTLQYEWLRERMAGHQVLIVDGVADAYGGNENDRGQVKKFVNAILGLIPTDGALLLQHHVNKLAAASSGTSEGYSGSTGWHNSVRARWYLHPEIERGDDGAQATGELLLELQKSNLGRADQSMRFRWDDDAHLFVGRFEQQSEFDRRHQEQAERDGIVAAIREVESTGGYVPAAAQGPRTALHVLAATESLPEALKKRPARKRFWRHIEHLRRIRIVRESSIRRENRHMVATLTLEAAPDKGCADAPHSGFSNTTQSGTGAPCAELPHSARGYRGARAHKCQRCDGAGCDWCEHKAEAVG